MEPSHPTSVARAERAQSSAFKAPTLDGLRGFAVLIVLASHLSNHRIFGNSGMALAGTGKSGVYLFFVLSAFLLTRLLLAKPTHELAGSRVWLDYALRRVLRIWPLYLLILLASWWLGSYLPAWHYKIDTSALLQHLALKAGQSVLWSIPVEFKAYLVLPVIVGAVVALRRYKPAVTAVAFALAFLGVSWVWPTGSMGVNTVELGPYLTAFIAGSAAAWLDLTYRESGHAVPASFPWVCGVWVVAMLVAWLALTPVMASLIKRTAVAADFNHHWIPVFALLWSSLLLALLYAPRRVQAIFDNPVMRFLGLVSFSLYLWHMVVIDFWKAAGWPTGLIPGLGLVLCALAISSVSYLLIERPFRNVRWKRHAKARPRSAQD